MVYKILFVYKEFIYEEPPINYYYIYEERIKGNIKYRHIKRKIPTFLHVIILLIFTIPILYINYINYNISNNITKNHVIRVPKEMYYNSETKVLDIDIINDESNFEIISISIKSKNNEEIISIKGIEPGNTIGSVKVDYNFNNLPLEAILTYRVYYNDINFKDITRNVLIIDSKITDKDINRYF